MLTVGVCDGVVLDLLKDPVQADDKVEAVHDQADADEADQRDLLVAEHRTDARRAVDPRQEVVRPWDIAVPLCGRARGAGDERGEEVVKRECERGGPRADEHDLDERVRELARRPPESEWTAEVLELRRVFEHRYEVRGWQLT